MSCIYVNIVNNQCKYDFVYKFPLMLQKERHRVIKPFKHFKPFKTFISVGALN